MAHTEAVEPDGNGAPEARAAWEQTPGLGPAAGDVPHLALTGLLSKPRSPGAIPRRPYESLGRFCKNSLDRMLQVRNFEIAT